MASEPVGYKFDGGLYADLALRVVLRDGKSISPPLLSAEFDVLVLFLKKPRTVIYRSDSAIGRRTSPRALDDYVSRIDKKLGIKDLFHTIRRVGYLLDTDVRPVFQQDQEQGSALHKASEIHFNLHRVDSLRHSLQQALSASAENPSLADAYVVVAYSYINLAQAAVAAELPSSAMPKARAAADRALSLNKNNARALGILGLISLIYDYEWQKAEDQLQAALKINPNEVGSLLAYAHLLVSSGRPERAFELMERAVKSDPTDMIVYASWGWIHLLGGQTDKAIGLGQKAISLYPQLPPAHILLGIAYETAGKTHDALRHFRRSLDLEASAFGLGCIGHLYGRIGKDRDCEATLRNMEHLTKNGVFAYPPAYCEALVRVGRCDYEGALNALERAYVQRCDWLMHLGVEPRWSPIREMARFKALMREVRIPRAGRHVGRGREGE